MTPRAISEKTRIVSRAALLAAIAGLSFAGSVAHAQIVDSGPVSIAIPGTTAGLYLNVVTNVSGPTAAGVPGWDLNPWGMTSRVFFWGGTAAPTGGGDATVNVYRPLALGDTVGPASTFLAGGGAASVNFQGTGPRTLGFRFLNETSSTVHFGYVTLDSAAAAGVPGTIIPALRGTIIRYVFQATANTAITVAAPGGGATAPIFGYAPAPATTVTATGGAAIGSTGNLSIATSVATPGSGTGAAATTTTTCTAPTAPFSGFGQTVTAIGTGAISGGPLAGTCIRGTAAVTQTLTCSENRGGTANARTWTLNCPAGTPIAAVPVFSYTPPVGTTVAGTGGGAIGSTANFSITASVVTAVWPGTGTPGMTTTTCTAPTALFAGFGQTVSAIGAGPISGGPLTGTCTLGASAATQVLTCSENRGGTATARTWILSCPAGTAPPVAAVAVNATSIWSLTALMLALFGFAAVAVRRQG